MLDKVYSIISKTLNLKIYSEPPFMKNSNNLNKKESKFIINNSLKIQLYNKFNQQKKHKYKMRKIKLTQQINKLNNSRKAKIRKNNKLI